MTDSPTLKPHAELTVADIEEATGLPKAEWSKNCHTISLAIVKSGVLGVPARVARGWARGVKSQHSWVVYGWPGDTELPSCYDPEALILDASLWSYIPGTPELLWTQANDGTHHPHGGEGHIMSWGQPPFAVDEPIDLTPEGGWPKEASFWMNDMLHGRPLDRDGWATIAAAPAGGWEKALGQLLAAMSADERTSFLVPIDKLGMLTELNPGGLYLDGPDLTA